MQRFLKRRALDGQCPTSVVDIIQRLEATAAFWNRHPTPFIWAGKRKARRHRAYLRRHRLPASGAAVSTSLAHFTNGSPHATCPTSIEKERNK
jgi:hypothetical protein